MKKLFPFIAFLLACLCIFACGDNVTTEQITEISQTQQAGMIVVDSLADLPECENESNGAMAWIRNDESVLVCLDGDWKLQQDSIRDSVEVFKSDTIVLLNETKVVSCSMVRIKDGSGAKILCDGDSVGVLMDGANGADAVDSVKCVLKESSDSAMSIKCAEETFSILFNNKKALPVCSDDMAEDEDCSLDGVSLFGYSEKGSFVKGTIVVAFELQNGKTLKQTGKSFVGTIETDNGLFKLNSVKLSSQYASLVAEGFYRNEVTGENSAVPVKLQAITNLKGRKSANINILTHLEYDRIFYLVTRKGMKVSSAKAQAEKEILSAFHFDAAALKLTGNSEDLTIFGESERNAALLAISILLQGDRSEAELVELLASFSDDFAMDGTWDDDAARGEIAEWASRKEFAGKIPGYRKNVEAWGLGKIPAFEKFMHKFWIEEYGLGYCDGDKVKSGDIREAKNGEKFECVDEDDSRYEFRLMKDARDGQFYKVVTIGSQVWMAENLNYRYVVNGKDYSNYCVEDGCAKYGRFYTLNAAKDSAAVFVEYRRDPPIRGVCPEGWHLPSKGDFATLAPDGSDGTALQAEDGGWSEPTNSTGFSAISAGIYYPDLDEHSTKIESALFWSYDGFVLEINQLKTSIYKGESRVPKALSVRCLLDVE